MACEDRLAGDDRAWIVRPSSLVGVPAHADLRDQAKLLFVDLCRQAARGDIVLHNDGLSYRDFLPFGDAFAALRLVLDAEPASVRLLNLARGESMRLDDAARLIQAKSPRSPGVKFGSGQDAFRKPFTASTGRLRKLGWLPSGSIEDEAAGIVKYFS
ncbi:MAG: NAD(P)-dependent oxidoreductase [Betaproteobacteria bacterium]|nr:NAD(P)-dependent oxidoreductase [Betaproteobacteria bacterium]